MIKIGTRELGKIPAIAVSISDREDNRILRSAFVDMVEIRVDQFGKTDPSHIRNIIMMRRKAGVPLILTVRSREEGGRKVISDDLKLKIFKDNIPLVDAVDIELKSNILPEVVRAARKNKKIVIVSAHDFKITPNDKILKDTLAKAIRSGAHIVKIAAKANREEDVARLMRFTMENKSKNMITISLGEIGSISRLIFPGFGSLITYAYISRPSGLGQRTLRELREHLRIYYPGYNRYFALCREAVSH
ncbi:type I 3-dehydroquinate dehydratase [bacterium]|nr:MAG: type I 3-dehydroquinate dehydratase [bacterium]